MSFLQNLQDQKSRLSHIKTTVTTPGGQIYIEDMHKNLKIEIGSSPGFIVDEKPDLQIAHVFPWLCMGSQDVAHDQNLLVENKITHILSLGIEPSHFQDIVYKHIQLLDLPESNLLKCIDTCIDFIESVREENGRIYIHCNAGVSRSAALVIAYIMYEKMINFDEAYQILKNLRSCIKPNPGFVNQLKMYERQLLDP